MCIPHQLVYHMTLHSVNLMFFLVTALAIHCKNVVCYVTLRSANHTVIRVVNTTQCRMIHQLVWYACCIFKPGARLVS